MYKLHLFDGSLVRGRFETACHMGYSYYIENEKGGAGITFHSNKITDGKVDFPTDKDTTNPYKHSSTVIFECETKEEMEKYLRNVEASKHSMIIITINLLAFLIIPALITGVLTYFFYSAIHGDSMIQLGACFLVALLTGGLELSFLLSPLIAHSVVELL